LAKTVVIRPALQVEDPLLAEHFVRMWQDIGAPPGAILPEAQAIALAFIERAQAEHAYAAFMAEVDGISVGSAGCQLFAGLYPNVLAPSHRQYGYIWGVYVEDSHRRLGIASQLTRAAMDYLRELGCTRAVLHASREGRPVYEALGYAPSNEMFIGL
jgi:GNAT superfamily N-acetyltransferase